MSLTENTAERTNTNLGFLRHNSRVDDVSKSAHKLYVASFLGRFHEPADSSRRLT
jgi:hypothetical protein